MLTATFLSLARRYWLSIFPRVARQRHRQRVRALRIPDPLLRRVALEAQCKWGNVEGAGALAAIAPARHRAAATRAMTSFQVAYNYVDLLGEQPGADPAANSRRLHEALLVALEPEAAHPDYYEHQVQREDGCYLREIVDGCRAALAELPSYPMVAPAARLAAQRIVAFQSANTGDPSEIGRQVELAEMERWARTITPPGSELQWWETAAAGGSSLGIFALIALAAKPDLVEFSVQAVQAAYFPWLGALHSLLDNLVDAGEDRATGQHNLIGCYDSSEVAAAHMGRLAERSLHAARMLPDGRAHTLVLAAMASFYLSDPHARTLQAQPVARAVLDVLDWPARLAMPVFKLRRGVGHEVESRAIDSHGASLEERLSL